MEPVRTNRCSHGYKAAVGCEICTLRARMEELEGENAALKRGFEVLQREGNKRMAAESTIYSLRQELAHYRAGAVNVITTADAPDCGSPEATLRARVEELEQHEVSLGAIARLRAVDRDAAIEEVARLRGLLGVPWMCPVCGGNGQVAAGFYNQSTGAWSGSGAAFEACRSCDGTGIVWRVRGEVE